MLKKVSKADLKTRKVTARDLLSVDQSLADLQILLVEDGPDNQILMRRFLEASGATVVLAVDGAEALNMALDRDYDLVLMDMQMPVLDGYEATKQLRAKGFTTPIVALTAHAMLGERDACLAAGCVEYISKPVKVKVLVDIVARFAKKKDLATYHMSDRSELADDPVVGPLVAKFVEALPQRMTTLRSAEQRTDWTEISNLAHQLAGACGGYGFPEIGRTAAKIEALAKSHQSPKILAESIAKLEALCDAAAGGISDLH